VKNDVPFLHVDHQHAFHEGLGLRTDVCGVPADVALEDDVVERVDAVFGVEGVLAVEHLVNDDAYAPDVALVAVGPWI